MAVLIVVAQAGVDILNLIDYPLVEALFTTFVQYHVLQSLEILRHRSLMTINAILQLGNNAYSLSALVNHRERLRDLSHLHSINHFSHFRRKVLHTELRRSMTCGHHVGRHQSLTVTSVLIVGEYRGCILKGELTRTNLTCDGVETNQCLLNSFVGYYRLTKNMAHIHLVATLLDKLDDMETEF